MFLGIDLGASALKFTVLDAAGGVHKQTRIALSTSHPQNGWAEQSPHEWREALFDGFYELSPLAAIEAIAFSGGAHIAVLCDVQDEVLAPAIMWSDQRASEQAQDLRTDPQVAQISGNTPNPTWTLPQLMWRRQNEPHIMARTARLYFAKDWLRAQISGDWTSDFSEAVGAMLAAIKQNDWSTDLLARAGLTRAQMPPLVAPAKCIGTILPDIAKRFGFSPATRILQGAIDTSIEWLCCVPLTSDTVSLKLASAGVSAVTIDKAQPLPSISLYPHILPAHYYYAAGNNNCMGALDWIRRVFLNECSIAQMEALAASAPRGAAGVLFHPYLQGERAPLWDASRMARLSGFNRASSAAHIARAAYEGIGFALLNLTHYMQKTRGIEFETIQLLGGGAQSALLRQIIADMLGIPLIIPAQSDASYGAALLAGGLMTGREQSITYISPDAHAYAFYTHQYARFASRDIMFAPQK